MDEYEIAIAMARINGISANDKKTKRQKDKTIRASCKTHSKAELSSSAL